MYMPKLWKNKKIAVEMCKELWNKKKYTQYSIPYVFYHYQKFTEWSCFEERLLYQTLALLSLFDVIAAAIAILSCRTAVLSVSKPVWLAKYHMKIDIAIFSEYRSNIVTISNMWPRPIPNLPNTPVAARWLLDGGFLFLNSICFDKFSLTT